MSNGNDNTVDFSGDDDLRDPVLRRALDHAPDRDAAPDPRTRDAIRKMAHNLAAAPTPAAAANNANAAPWWRRLFAGGGTHARMPWNAAFATVLVATFVAVLWHREPIPDARLDGEARVGGAVAPAPAAAPTPPSAEPAPQAPSPAIVAQQAPAAPVAEAPAAPARDSAKEAQDRGTADAVRRPVPAPARKEATPAPEINRTPPESPPLPPPAPTAAQAPAPLPAPATVAPGIAEQAARARQKSEGAQDERPLERRSSGYAAAPAPSAAPPSIAEPDRTQPVIAAAPVAPGAAAPRRESTDSASASIARGGSSANAEASGALRDAPPPRAAVAAKAAGAPAGASSFSALDRWTSFNVTRDGVGVRHARGDIEGLAALVNAVARSATAADAQLAAPVEARLSLYQGSTLIAVLEIAGDQVRWTPQPGGGASVGTPPAQTLAALRAVLTR
jgi:hypothetical protein